MSLQEPDPNVPDPNPMKEEDEEEEKEKKRKHNDDEEEEDEEEEEEERAKPKVGVGKPGRDSITMYGAISGDYKCPYCTTAHKFFSSPAQWKKFSYKHVDIYTDKAMKLAQRKGIDRIPFFRVRKAGETRDEWVEGLGALNELLGTNLK